MTTVDPAARRPTPATAPRRPFPVPPAEPPVPRLVAVAWTLMVVNTLGFTTVAQIIPFPRQVGQVVTMGALVAALGLALLLNPRIRIRPTAYLLFLTLILVLSIVSSLRLESGYGALFRCFRLTLFVTTLWLLTPWWRGDLRFVGYHLRALVVVLGSVLLGLLISPGSAFSGPDGRLVGAIWPIPAPQVGMYCAITIGLCVLLWIGKVLPGRTAAVVAVPALALLLLSHTRTSLLGLVVGLAVAGLSVATTSRRARRAFAGGIAVAGGAALLFSGVIITWLARGQDADQLASLTGRANVWDQLLARPRTLDELLIGVGLTDKSYGGLPIDNAWLAVFNEEGWIGIVLVVAMLLTLLGVAVLRPPSIGRTCAIFIVVYGITASYTEVGLGDASPYLLNMAVAASLLVHRRNTSPEQPVAGTG